MVIVSSKWRWSAWALGCLLSSTLLACSDSPKKSVSGGEIVALTGRAFSADDATGLTGASVSIDDQQVNTGEGGLFSVEHKRKEQASVSLQGPNHAPVSKALPTGDAYVELFAKRIDSTAQIDTDKGGSVRSEKGALLQVSGGALQTADGKTAKEAVLAVASPGQKGAKDLASLPGDLKSEGGDKPGKLASKGATYVTASAEGATLKIAAGQKATIALPAHDKKKAAQVPTLYWFDDALSLWVAQGPAMLGGDAEGASVYSAEVDRLGWFMVGELLTDLSCASVCVTHDGSPVPFAQVVATGIDLFTQSTAFTGEDGCANLELAANTRYALSALAQGALAGPVEVSAPSGGNIDNPASCHAVPALAFLSVAGDACPTGFAACGGSCVDTSSDVAHCGGCDVSCGESACVAGRCEGTSMEDGGVGNDGGTAVPDGGTTNPDGGTGNPDSGTTACFFTPPAPADAGADGQAVSTFAIFELWVDSVGGSDTAPCTSASPCRSITHAVDTWVAPGDTATVHLAEGTYNAASGEIFPIVLPSGVTLEGEVSLNGSTISGAGIYGGNSVAVAAEGINTISNVIITVPNTVNTWGVSSLEQTTIANVTFNGNGGVFVGAGTVNVTSCAFQTTSLGVFGCGIGGRIDLSTFASVATPIVVTAGACTIDSNQIGGSGTVGVQMELSGNHVLTNNTFVRGAGYANGAIRAMGNVQAKLRSNIIDSVAQAAVLNEGTSYLDLGTPSDPGGNTLGRVDAVGLDQRSTAIIPAFGNTWAHDPATFDVDIKLGAGAAQVALESGDFCAP